MSAVAPSQLPMALTAKVVIVHETLTIVTNDITLQHRLQGPAAEWIWQELLGDPKVREATEISGCKIWVDSRGLKLVVGDLPLFKQLDSTRISGLVERQQQANAGRKSWKPVVM